MVFSSQLFLFWFLPAALAGYYVAPRRLKHLVLTLFSYVFYGWANPAFSILLLLSTTIDWVAGLVMVGTCLLYTSPSPRDRTRSRMPSSA